MPKKKYELINQRDALLKVAEDALNEGKTELYNSTMNSIKELNVSIEAANQLDIERGRFEDNDVEKKNAYEMFNAKKEEAKKDQSLSEILSEKEYVRAFCNAIKNKYSEEDVLSGAGGEMLNPLRNALTIAGNPTGGQDGGFLVPEDLSTKIIYYRRSVTELAKLVNVENVNTPTGSRPICVFPGRGFTKIEGELKPIPNDHQPTFSQVQYNAEKYGLFIPISLELIQDEDANLLDCLARWFGTEQVATENALIIGALNKATASKAKGKLFDKVKTALNVELDPAISLGASIITNQTGFNLLDLEKDSTGNYMLQNTVKRTTERRFAGDSVAIQSNKDLPDVSGAAPIYIGDFKQYMTLFRRKYLTIESTTTGGDSWRNYGYEVRGITRLGTAIFDKEAAVKLNVKPETTGATS